MRVSNDSYDPTWGALVVETFVVSEVLLLENFGSSGIK